ncbi:MAG: hypothetical protein WCA16_06920 [Candidatus Sulfotelmatobacter sp.]
MRSLLFFCAGLVLVAVTAPPLYSQQATGGNSDAIVSFTLDFPASDPSHYSISVRQDGHGAYESSAKVADDSEDQLYEFEFEVSATNRDRIFAWAKQADFFAGALDSGNHKLAFTGTKTFSYQDGPRKYSASFNYSTSSAVQQLAALFESMSTTLEYGRMLAYSHRYQKLALDDELRHLETQASSHELSEIQAIGPVLQEIVDDPSVINLVRARAQRLIAVGKAASTGRH